MKGMKEMTLEKKKVVIKNVGKKVVKENKETVKVETLKNNIKKNSKKPTGPQTYERTVSEPWFSFIKMGTKKVEGRLNKGVFADMKKGDTLEFVNYDFGFPRKISTKITSTKTYPTFRDYLTGEGIDVTLPTVENIEDGVKVYYKYYKPKNEEESGVVALRFDVV